MRYAFIETHEKMHSVKQMCKSLEVSRSGYYAWCKRPASQRAEANQALLQEIKNIHQTSRKTYGSPRIHAELQTQGKKAGRHRVARLMREHGIVAGKPKKRYSVTTQRRPGALAAPNLLNQDFSATQPDQKWVSDITYIDTAEGWLYLAVIVDLFSRTIVGWAMADHMETSLIESAFKMAWNRRTVSIDLLHHSDQGSQYTSYDYQDLLSQATCQVSMSRVGNCYDNAVVESFFGTLKTECAYYPFATHQQARSVIFEYIEIWYNRQRIHSTLGYLTPLAFEQQFLSL